MAVISYAACLPPRKYKQFSRMDMYAKLFSQFLRDTGKKKQEVEGVFVTGHSLGMAEEQIIDYLKLSPRHCAAFDVGGATASFMLKEATFLIEKGFLKNAVVIGTGKFGEMDREVSLRNTSHPDFEAIYGPSMPSFYALYGQKYLTEFHVKEEELALVPVMARQWANMNPDAFMYGKPLSVEDVLSSPYIATPFRLFDCSIPLDGGGLIFLERENSTGRPSVFLIGYGESHAFGYISTNNDFLSTAAVHSGKQAFSQAGLKPEDMDILEIYDAFSICPVILLEDLGFYAKGEAMAFFKEGRGEFGGDLPLNTYGGLLSYGHPGMPAGFHPLVEAILQLQNLAGQRQVKEARRALAHCYGGMFANHITVILTNEKP